MKRALVFFYGVLCYAVFFLSFLYAIGWIGNFGVPTRLDGPPTVPLITALLVDLGLLLVFAVQHSVMARPSFKKAWTRIVARPVERSTYVLLSSLLLFALFWLWEPIGSSIWNVTNETGRTALFVLYGLGWGFLLYGTFLIDHFDLMGLRQTWMYFRGRAYEFPKFFTPGPYKWIRHPIYVGWLTIFWATPTMTAGHLVFALATTAYILVAIQLEERDLMTFHVEYREYRKSVPMLIPRFGRSRPKRGRPAA